MQTTTVLANIEDAEQRRAANNDRYSIGVAAAAELAKRVLDCCWLRNGTSVLRRLEEANVVSYKPGETRRYYRAHEWDNAVEFIIADIARQIRERPPHAGELEANGWREVDWYERYHYFPHRLLQPLVDLGPFPPLLPRADITPAETRAIMMDRLEELGAELEPAVEEAEWRESLGGKRLRDVHVAS